MKIVCIEKLGANLNLSGFKTTVSNQTIYSVSVGEEYLVMGICSYHDDELLYYLVDLGGSARWFPELLFKVTDNQLPRNWFIRTYSRKEHEIMRSIISFKELCYEKKFDQDLIEYETYAFETFYRRKKEIEEEFSDKKDADDLDPDWWEKLK